jgi:hypothetical protein
LKPATIFVNLMDGTQLASALAERLAQVLPEGFSISSMGHELWLDTPDGYGNSAWAAAVDENSTDLSLYSGAAENVLNSIQDGVSMTLRKPWPLEMVGGKRQMAMPGAKVIDGALELWYGKEDAPAIRLQPINLRD